MSYILEALKKSEKQRQIGEVPSFKEVVHQDVAVVKDHNSTIVAVAVLLLLFNLALVGYWGFTTSSDSNKEVSDAFGDPVSTTHTASIEPTMQEITYSNGESSSVREGLKDSQSGTIKQYRETLTYKAKTVGALHSVSEYSSDEGLTVQSVGVSNEGYQLSDGEEEPRLTPANEFGQIRNRVALLNGQAASTAGLNEQQEVGISEPFEDAFAEGPVYSWDQLPTVDELNPSLRDKVPADLDLSSHMYSTNALSRSIILNGRFLKPAQALNSDVEVVEIVEQGVILSVNDYYFRIFLEQ